MRAVRDFEVDDDGFVLFSKIPSTSKTPGIIFFPSNSVLGFGTFGYVYKAKLASSGEYVALKLFAQPSKGHIYH
jgi:serine/threonine protein kinase